MRIIGHRGSAGTMLENTLAAIEEGFVCGADGVEVDVRLSADGQIVVHHDKTLHRLSDSTLRVKKTLAEELLQYPLSNGVMSAERMPLLAEVLERLPVGKQLFIEVKSSERLVPVLAKLLAKHQINLDQIVVISFRSRVVKAIRYRLPSVKVLYLSEKPLGRNHSSKVIEIAKAIGAHGLGLEAEGLTLDVAREIKAEGMYLNAWTVNDIEQMVPLELIGVDALTTDYPREFAQVYHELYNSYALTE